jgi:prepilin-type N-terminal cleavage/methylation domain-containing protein
MYKQVTDFQINRAKLSNSSGFSMVELIVVIALIGTVSSIALINVTKSNRTFNVAGASRTLSAYLEKARVDSIRRHDDASITMNSTSSYTVNIDFDGDGTITERTITLPEGASLSYSLPPATTSINPSTTPITITYNWRGRTGSAVLLTITDSIAGVRSSTVAVGPSGDISVDTAVTGPVTTPTPQNTTVTTTTGIKSMY